MNERFQSQTATRPQVLRTEPRLEAAASTPSMAPRSPIPPIGGAAPARAGGYIAGQEASGPGLLRSTLKAGGVAAAILAVFYLPAEYGVDPTGIGGLLGLTEMGQIKQQLYAEAAADDAALATVGTSTAVPADLAARLDGIEAQVAAIAAVVGASDSAASVPAPPPMAEAASVVPELAPAPAPEEALVPEEALASIAVPPAASEAPAVPAWRDEITATLAPMEGIEVKLVMEEGQVARFEWSANGGVLNHDTHGDGSGQDVTYEEGRAIPAQEGTLTAAFTGNHGWFWRNRTDAPVTLTLRTGGEYAEMVRP